jgi:hypothetical protein
MQEGTAHQEKNWLIEDLESKMCVFFMHIPKTGGVSVETFLRSLVNPEEIAPYPRTECVANLSDPGFAEYRYFVAHAPAHIEQLLPRPLFTFSWLRDPVDRSISAYNHILRYPDHRWHQRLIDETSDFESFLEHPQLRLHLVDVMTRYFGSDVNLLSFAGNRQEAALASKRAQVTLPDKQVLIRAKERLLAFDFIGFCNSMQEDCMTLAAKLGLPTSAPVPHVNADPRSETVRPRVRRTPDIENLIARHSPYDIELYQFACEHVGKDPIEEPVNNADP